MMNGLQDLIHAAIASSAPVHAAVDMPGYNDVTAQAYGIAAAGGSDDCNSSIARGHAKIGQLMVRKQAATNQPCDITK